MSKEKIKKINHESSELGQKILKLDGILRSSKNKSGHLFDINHKLPNSVSTIADNISVLTVASDIIRSASDNTKEDTNNALLVPSSSLDELSSYLIACAESTSVIINDFRVIDKQHEGLSVFNYNIFTASTNDGVNHNLSDHFLQWENDKNTLLRYLNSSSWPLLYLQRTSYDNTSSLLQSMVKQFREEFDSLSQSSELIKRKEEESSELLQSVLGVLDKSKDYEEKILDIYGKIERDKQSSNADLGEIAQNKSGVDEIRKQAERLRSEVESYQNDFELFKKQLEEREQLYNKNNENLQELIRSFKTKEESISHIVTKAEQMLSAATVTGLATNFKEIEKSLSNSLLWARIAFYVGVFFLTVLALPLLLYVAAPFWMTIHQNISPEIFNMLMEFRPNAAENGWQYFGQIAARIVVLLPALLLISFASIRHSSIFRLREHYSYKYSMAVAVEGFRKQAPEYESEIAAMVLEELAFNPADKLSKPGQIRERRLLNIMIEKIRDRLGSSVHPDNSQ